METKTYIIIAILLIVGGFLVLKQKDTLNSIFTGVKKKEKTKVKECTCNKNKKDETE